MDQSTLDRLDDISPWFKPLEIITPDSPPPLPLVGSLGVLSGRVDQAKTGFDYDLPEHRYNDMLEEEVAPICSSSDCKERSRCMQMLELKFGRQATTGAEWYLVYDRDNQEKEVKPTSSENSLYKSLPARYRKKVNLVQKKLAPENEIVQFDSFFESGNLQSAFRVKKRIFQRENSLSPDQAWFPQSVDAEYDLFCRPDIHTRGYIQWYYFTMKTGTHSKGLKVRLNIRNMMKTDSLYNYGMLPVLYSETRADQENIGWYRAGVDTCYYLGNAAWSSLFKGHSIDKTYYTFSVILEIPYSQDTLHIAHCFPYTYSYLQRFLRSIEECPTRSRFVRRKPLVNSMSGNRCDLLTITAPAMDKSTLSGRAVIFFTARVHPGETNGSYLMHGIIQFLTGPSEKAIALRERYIFKVIPMINPDGVIHGNYRCSLAGTDLNRRYFSPSEDYHPTIFALKKLCEETKEHRSIILYCDLHGHSKKKNVFLYGCRPYVGQSRMDRARVRLYPYVVCKESPAAEDGLFSFRDCRFSVRSSKRGTGRIVMWKDMRILHSFTVEASFCSTGRNARTLRFEEEDQMEWKHFTTEALQAAGQQLCESILTFKQALQGNHFAEGSDAGGTNTTDFYYESNATALFHELCEQLDEMEELGGEDDSDGSDSDPEADDLDEDELQECPSWAKFVHENLYRKQKKDDDEAESAKNPFSLPPDDDEPKVIVNKSHRKTKQPKAKPGRAPNICEIQRENNAKISSMHKRLVRKRIKAQTIAEATGKTIFEGNSSGHSSAPSTIAAAKTKDSVSGTTTRPPSSILQAGTSISKMTMLLQGRQQEDDLAPTVSEQLPVLPKPMSGSPFQLVSTDLQDTCSIPLRTLEDIENTKKSFRSDQSTKSFDKPLTRRPNSTSQPRSFPRGSASPFSYLTASASTRTLAQELPTSDTLPSHSTNLSTTWKTRYRMNMEN